MRVFGKGGGGVLEGFQDFSFIYKSLFPHKKYLESIANFPDKSKTSPDLCQPPVVFSPETLPNYKPVIGIVDL